MLLVTGLAGLAVGAWFVVKPEPVAVDVIAVEIGTVESIVANTKVGTVKSCRRAKISPGQGGQIAVLPVKEGDRVGKGQLLMALWSKDLAAQLRLVERETEAAEARARASCTKADVTRREADRLLRLQTSGAVSEEQTEKAVADAKALAADCEAAKRQAMVSAANIGVQQALLERTRLLAPFAGVIAQINGELNEYVTPSPPGIATLPAVDLIDDTCVYVTAPIDEVDVPAIATGMSSRIRLDAFADRPLAGRVRRIADYVMDREKQARTVDVEVAFTASLEATRLLAGYSADVEIIVDRHDDVLMIPTAAILEGNRVLILDPATSRLTERTIEIGLDNWDDTEVTDGLVLGELVVTSLANETVKAGVLAKPARPGQTVAEPEQ